MSLSAKITWRVKAGLIAALLLVIVKFVVFPLNEWKDDALHRISVLQMGVAKKKVLIGNEEKVNVLVEKAESFFNETAKYFYTNFSDTRSLQLVLQKEMEQLASAGGVKIKRKSWLYPTEGEIIKAPIKIKCEAGTDEIIQFIYAIESLKYFISVDRLKITSRNNSSVLQAELDISAHGLKK